LEPRLDKSLGIVARGIKDHKDLGTFGAPAPTLEDVAKLAGVKPEQLVANLQALGGWLKMVSDAKKAGQMSQAEALRRMGLDNVNELHHLLRLLVINLEKFLELYESNPKGLADALEQLGVTDKAALAKMFTAAKAFYNPTIETQRNQIQAEPCTDDEADKLGQQLQAAQQAQQQ
jgi:hypothetical protein